MSLKEILVPDIGDFAPMKVTEILVQVGDEIHIDDSLIIIESDKASIEIPSSETGKVVKIMVALGDNIVQGEPFIATETFS